MGLKSWISGSSGKQGDALFFSFGRDQHFCRKYLEGSGSHYQDDDRLLAHYSAPGCIGEHTQKANGQTRPLKPVGIAYELITGLWNFPTRAWAPKMETKAGKSESDMVLDLGFAEGFADASQKQEKAAWMHQLTTVLLLVCLGVLLIITLIGIQTGVIGNFFAGIGNFFH